MGPSSQTPREAARCGKTRRPQRLRLPARSGAAQLVEIRERVEEIVVPVYIHEKPALFARVTDEQLLAFGVPPEWLADVRALTEEDALLALTDHLPKEAGEALLDLATGVTPKAPQPAIPGADPFAHPDAQRRFRTMGDREELERALEYPWEKWALFLHPAQRKIVERDFSGPARVAGSAGTGKTIVALHRAAFLARRNPHDRVLLTTFSEPLANALRTKLRALIHHEPRMGERIEVHALNVIARRLYEKTIGPVKIASRETVIESLRPAVAKVKVSLHFLLTEWEQVVDAWQLETWEGYRDVPRLGRRTRLPEKQREVLWEIFRQMRTTLAERDLITEAQMLSRLKNAPFEFIVVDEAQDISVPQLRFLAASSALRIAAERWPVCMNRAREKDEAREKAGHFASSAGTGMVTAPVAAHSAPRTKMAAKPVVRTDLISLPSMVANTRPLP